MQVQSLRFDEPYQHQVSESKIDSACKYPTTEADLYLQIMADNKCRSPIRPASAAVLKITLQMAYMGKRRKGNSQAEKMPNPQTGRQA